MRQLRWVLPVFLCSAITAWAQGAPQVYVSGTDGSISRVTSAGSVSTLISASSTALYEGLVVGPDNADNTTHTFLLYACDPTHNMIVRFDPEDMSFGIETIYKGDAKLQAPQCGRFTNSGDLIVTSKASGGGTWKFAGIASKELGALANAPVLLTQVNAPKSSTLGEGIAQKNIGDALIVDVANSDVLRSPYAGAFSTTSVFIAASAFLPGPVGIARKSNGEIYVSNQSRRVNNVVHYDAQGLNPSVCVSSFGNKVVPFFMQVSADDTLYVATQNSNSGTVFSVNTATCAATAIPTGNTLAPLIGIALPPTEVSQTQTFSGTGTFNFGFAAYQFTASGSCTLTVSAMPTNLPAIRSLISQTAAEDASDLPFGAIPVVNLGLDGFELLFNVVVVQNCTSPFGDNTFDQFLAEHVDDILASNPRIARCATLADPLPAGCNVMESFGDYYLGGILPSDIGISLKGSNCQIFLLQSNFSNSEPGKFCGFESPLTTALPPNIAGTFSTGQNLALKFRLASASGNCKKGPFITDAVALLSVAQIADASGNPVFNPISINASGSSTPVPPTFKVDNNSQYQLSLSLQGYAPGTYSLTVTFLTSNAPSVTIEIQVI